MLIASMAVAGSMLIASMAVAGLMKNRHMERPSGQIRHRAGICPA
jgi:hypothetical protein